MISQGDVWWAHLPPVCDSGPGFRRPVVIVQGDAFNRSRIGTTICVLVTSNLDLARLPVNVLLPASATGLPRDSVANVSQILTLDRSRLEEPVGTLSSAKLEDILRGIRLVLGGA